jgi:DNA-binding SARP family transcriptional activator
LADNQKQADNSQLLKENAQLKKLLLTAQTALKEHQKADKAKDATIETLTGKVASIERERREEKIASILQGAYADAELKEQIENFAKSGMTFEAIEKAVAPLSAAKKKLKQEEDEQDKEAKINEKAAELAKNASVGKSYGSNKVAIKNAVVEDTPSEPEVPAWAVIHGGIS